jgi:uncharacterized protein (DUF2147 family)
MTNRPAAAGERAPTVRATAIRAAAIIGLAIGNGGAAAQAPPATPAVPGITGVWYDDTGKGAIEIGMCGDKLCGHIVWLKEPNDKSGRPLTDGYNPQSSMRGRPICGLQVIGNVQRISGSTWDKGWIYDPKEGKSYDVEIKLRAPDRLSVTGYLGVKFLSETFEWRRAPADLARCTTAAAAPSGAGFAAPQATAR